MTPLKILHLSDTHLSGDGSRHYGVVDTEEAFARSLDQFSGAMELDLLVISGDLSDDGSPRSYQKLRAMAEPWAAARNARVIYAMGNHDLRTNFRQVLGNGHGVRTGQGIDATDIGSAHPVDAVSTIGPWRIITIDSSVPGAGYGELDSGQVRWLREVLSTTADAGTVLVIHHPPVPASTALLQALELYNPEDLLDAVHGSDIRVILSGHYHHPLRQTFAGFPLIVTPGIANTTDMLAPEGTERAVVGSGGTLITVASDDVRSSVLRAYGPDDGQQIFHLARETVADIVGEAGRVDTR
ncbi:MAG: metallophosphoesterase [Lacisediminihabitans sp.]